MGSYLLGVETDRELAVRTVACPVCGARNGKRCRYGYGYSPYNPPASAHTGRYDVAVSAGLVPALGGVR